MKNNKGYSSRGCLIIILALGVIIYIAVYFVKKITTSADKVAQESATAIYEAANLYYVNTMMLMNIEEYECDFKKNNCDKLKFASTTKPNAGYLNIYKGKVNARLIYNNIEYYICDNVATNDKKCALDISRDIMLRNILDYYAMIKTNEFNGYECDFSKNNCYAPFNKMFEHTGNIVIDKNGNIEANLSVGDYKYYICNVVSDDPDCLKMESAKKIVTSLKEYHSLHANENNYNGFKCNIASCDDLKFLTLTHPKGEIVLNKVGKINGRLDYNGKIYYICNDEISLETCK